MTERPSGGPLPLVVGVAGHRDIPDDSKAVERLESAVERILSDLRKAHPHTPIVVMTGLADGADQLAARVARKLAIPLLVPLAMPQDVFETTLGDVAAFRELIVGADVFTLPLAPGNTAEAVRTTDDAKDLQYGVLAAFVARHCHALIALWEGGELGPEKELRGGTSQVVRFHLDGVPDPLMPAQYPPDPVDRGPVWHVVTPRRGKTPPRDAFEVHVRLPSGHASEDAARRIYDGMRERVDTFNADAADLLRHGMTTLPSDGSSLVPKAEAGTLPPHVHETARRHAIADALATKWQRRTYAALETLPWMAALAVLALQGYADWWPSRWLLSAYVVLLGIAWGYYWWTLRRSRTQDRFQDYRALAEGLRVEFFSQAVGASGCTADKYLGRQRGELGWIRQALRTWGVTTPAARSAMLGEEAPASREALVLARDHWIATQADYYARAARRDAKRLHWWERRRTAAFLVSVLVAVAASAVAQVAARSSDPDSWLRLALDHAGREDVPHGAELGHAFVVTLIVFSAVIAGFIEYFAGRRAYEQHARQYQRMATDFGLLRRRLDVLLDAGRLDEARRHLVSVATIALTEHGDWVILHRERTIDVPQGG